MREEYPALKALVISTGAAKPRSGEICCFSSPLIALRRQKSAANAQWLIRMPHPLWSRENRYQRITNRQPYFTFAQA
jgi:hypothetical protein